ncbi:MAG: TetR/AcrR family transcriptional regulator [Ruminococcaceae bacterium]|nr:TetR/AcrR family transcriptional regulator [Oscillospiraceae bacterium]
MGKKNSRNTKGKIVSAAWKLFYEQGYDDTTVDDIITASETSKGSFYHYFDSKDSLLGSLAYLFDEKYEELENQVMGFENCIDALIFLNKELFDMIETTVDLELIKRLYSTQLLTKSEKQLLDHNRVYYKLLRKIIINGQSNGSITKEQSVNDIVKYYAFCERAIIYDWCLCNGDYSLSDSAANLLPFFLNRIKNL